jgi:hypothetical protein
MLTVLFVSSNPRETDQLKLNLEFNRIRSSIDSIKGGNIRLEPAFDIQINDLKGMILKYDPQIVHFSGHGSPIGELVMTGPKGEINPIPPERLSKYFELLKENISLVFLNLCYSEEQAKAISKHIDLVIGMNDSIPDDIAINFALNFYSSLWYERNSVKTAFELAKLDLDLSSVPESSVIELISKKGIDPSHVYIKHEKFTRDNVQDESSDIPINGSIINRIVDYLIKSNTFLSLDKDNLYVIETDLRLLGVDNVKISFIIKHLMQFEETEYRMKSLFLKLADIKKDNKSFLFKFLDYKIKEEKIIENIYRIAKSSQ